MYLTCCPDAFVLRSLQYGLYSSFMGCLAYLFVGSAKDVTLGPTAIMSLMVNRVADPSTYGVNYAVTLSLICGVVQLLMSMFRLGKHSYVICMYRETLHYTVHSILWDIQSTSLITTADITTMGSMYVRWPSPFSGASYPILGRYNPL